jgi:succinoglycan biosynthesis protein ExoA
MDNQPFVSIVIPCWNEAAHITGCLESVLANTYPKARMEVLVVDGLSTDGTREILQRHAAQHPFLRVLDNPGARKSAGLNRGIREAKGEIIIRMDAHAEYARDYVAKCVAHLQASGADNVGGIRRTQPGGPGVMARAIAVCVSHPFAAGNAHYRTGAESPRWVDTVFGGCYRREVFDRIGLFHEQLTRAQDREFNQRLRDAGGKILLVPDIECVYFARRTLRQYARWMFESGVWPFYAGRLSGRRIVTVRNFVPMLFVLALAGTAAASFLFPWGWMSLAALLAVYGGATASFTVRTAVEQRDARLLLILPVVFAVTHVCYGAGSLYGLVKPIPQAPAEQQK